MNPLNIPTDNLYKFLAITGLVILIGVNGLFVIYGDMIAQYGTTQLQNAAIATYEQKVITEDKNVAQKTKDELEKILQTLPTQSKQSIIDQIIKEQEIINVDNNKFDQANRDIITFNKNKLLAE